MIGLLIIKHLIMTSQSNEIYKKIKHLMSNELALVDEVITNLSKFTDKDIINKILHYSNSNSGKKIRPILSILCAKAIGCQDTQNLINISAASELIHTATLFHDDVIDESSLRRGKETINAIWGNKNSILVGDFILTHAFRLMIETKNISVLNSFVKASMSLTEAEIWQLNILGDFSLSYNAYIKLIRGKTSELFASSCANPAYLINQDDTADILYNFGLNLGTLFQLADDTLDYFAIDSDFGKKIGADFFEKKITLPLIILLQKATHSEKSLIQDLMNQENLKSVEEISAMMERYKILELCIQEFEIYSNTAIKLASKLPQNEFTDLLIELVDFLRIRSY